MLVQMSIQIGFDDDVEDDITVNPRDCDLYVSMAFNLKNRIQILHRWYNKGHNYDVVYGIKEETDEIKELEHIEDYIENLTHAIVTKCDSIDKAVDCALNHLIDKISFKDLDLSCEIMYSLPTHDGISVGSMVTQIDGDSVDLLHLFEDTTDHYPRLKIKYTSL